MTFGTSWSWGANASLQQALSNYTTIEQHLP